MKNNKKNNAFVKPSGAKQNKFFIHVEVVRSIKIAMVNNKTRVKRVFSLLLFKQVETKKINYISFKCCKKVIIGILYMKLLCIKLIYCGGCLNKLI